jgi:hypothetical protein
LVLLFLLSMARADEDPSTIASGKWGLRLFLQFDTAGNGAWGDAKAGAMARFESTYTAGRIPDPVGGGGSRRKKPKPKVSQHEVRVVQREGGQLALETRSRPSNERGEPGKWEKPRVSELPVIETGSWKVERVGDTTYPVGSRPVAATSYRVRIPGGAGAEEVWTVVLGGDLGVLHARQETGNGIEWMLVRTDVELKAGGRKLLCREYKFGWRPPSELERIAVKERRMFLSDEVPGRVVRQTHSGFLGARVEENLIAFQGR